MDPYLHKLYVCVIDNGTQYMYVYWTMDNSREMLDLTSYTSYVVAHIIAVMFMKSYVCVQAV